VERTPKPIAGREDELIVPSQEAITVRVGTDWIVLSQEYLAGAPSEITVRRDYLRWLIEGLQSIERTTLNDE